MAYTTGTADNYQDLLERLKTFITTDPILVQANQQWSVIRDQKHDAERELIFKGKGLSGLDEIFVGIKTYSDKDQDFYNWRLNGFIGYSPSADFKNQPGSINLEPAIIKHDRTPAVALWNKPIQYWFVANGRRIIVVMKVSSVYESLYLGFLRPYATPNQYPYPLIIGGSMTGQTHRWSTRTTDHRQFIDAGFTHQEYSSLAKFHMSGQWHWFYNWYQYSSGDSRKNNSRLTWPYRHPSLNKIRNMLNDDYNLTPIILAEKNPKAVWGELDGCFHVSGFGSSAEDIIQVGDQSYLVIQNVFRTGIADFWALKLE